MCLTHTFSTYHLAVCCASPAIFRRTSFRWFIIYCSDRLLRVSHGETAICKHSALLRERREVKVAVRLLPRLRIAADCLLDPLDIRWDTRNDALSTIVESKAVDANNSPRVLLIFTRQWTSTVTLPTQQRSTCVALSHLMLSAVVATVSSHYGS